MDSKIFNLLKPLTDYIDSGRFFRQPFQWLYYLIGVLCVLSPLAFLYTLIESKVFRYADGGEIFAIILIWLIFGVVCVFGGLLWISRGKKLKELLPENSKFVALPCIANFIQTSGEFTGLFIGIIGFIGGVIGTIFGVGGHLPIVPATIPTSILSVIFGYLTIVFTRYVSELVLAIASIANNTEIIAKK